MSAIGSGSIGALNLAGSIAGAQRNHATANESRAEAAGKSFQLDAARMTAQANGDVSDPELSTDRDADGRMPYEEPDRTEVSPDAEPEELKQDDQLRCSTDPSGERGSMLDLQV